MILQKQSEVKVVSAVLEENKLYQEVLPDPTVFRAYDIRGIINENFNENAFYTIGRAISCRLYELKRSHVFLGFDGRLTSSSLAQALKQGLLDSGIHVYELGQISTPILYYATFLGKTDCGVMVTGSHNPANYNGIKIVLAGKTLVQADINSLLALVKNGIFRNGQGQSDTFFLIDQYIQRIISDIQLARSLKVVVDAGNGAAGPFIVEALCQLGCEVIPLYCDVDGHFPNHHPDPTVESNLVDLKEQVILHQADIGLAFDGDADRLGVVSNNTQVIWPDRLIMFYAEALLKKQPGATIVYDVKCSAHLAKFIGDRGGNPLMCPTGHSIVKSEMKQTGAVLAGEMSGHLFFQDRWYGFDDALYSACRLLELLSQSSETVEEQFSKIPESIHTPELTIIIDDRSKFKFMENFCQQANFPGASLIRIDGLRVEFEQGWGLIRASNTTPCLVTRFEAQDHSILEQIKTLFKQQILKIDDSLEIPF